MSLNQPIIRNSDFYIENKEEDTIITADIINNSKGICIINNSNADNSVPKKLILYTLETSNISKTDIYIKNESSVPIYIINKAIRINPGSIVYLWLSEGLWELIINPTNTTYRLDSVRSNGVKGIFVNLWRGICIHSYNLRIADKREEIRNPAITRLKRLIRDFSDKNHKGNMTLKSKNEGNMFKDALGDSMTIKKFLSLLAVLKIIDVQFIITITTHDRRIMSFSESLKLDQLNSEDDDVEQNNN